MRVLTTICLRWNGWWCYPAHHEWCAPAGMHPWVWYHYRWWYGIKNLTQRNKQHQASYMCSITPESAKVSCIYIHMWGPGSGRWCPDHSNCSHWSFEAAVLPINTNICTDKCELLSFLCKWSLYNYTTHMADILIPNAVVWRVDNHRRGLCSRHCCRICIGWWRSTFHVDLAKNNPNQGSEPTTGYTSILLVLYFCSSSIEQQVERPRFYVSSDRRQRAMSTNLSIWRVLNSATHPGTGPTGWLLNLSVSTRAPPTPLLLPSRYQIVINTS